MVKKRVAICLLIAFAGVACADRAQNVICQQVRDFSSDVLEREAAKRKRRRGIGIVPFNARMRMAMFNRRKGLYVNTPEDDPQALPFIKGIRPVRSYIEIKDPDCVSLFFEDAEGRRTSCRAFMRGTLTDCCFFWGNPGSGVLAWYGVADNTMAVLVSPGSKAIPLHYVKTDASETAGKKTIELVEDQDLLTGIPDSDTDPIDVICTDADWRKTAKIIREEGLASPFAQNAQRLNAAYYVMALGTRQINWLTNWHGGGWTHLYMRLSADGELRYVLAENGKRFEQWGIGDPEKPWWDYLRPGSDRYANTTWILTEDTLTERICYVMVLSSRIDGCISASESASISDKMQQYFEKLLEPLTPSPNRWFSTRVFKRLDPLPGNERLRRSIDDAPWVGAAFVPNQADWFEKE